MTLSCMVRVLKHDLFNINKYKLKIYNNFISVLPFPHFLDRLVFSISQHDLGLSGPLKGRSRPLTALLSVQPG